MKALLSIDPNGRRYDLLTLKASSSTDLGPSAERTAVEYLCCKVEEDVAPAAGQALRWPFNARGRMTSRMHYRGKSRSIRFGIDCTFDHCTMCDICMFGKIRSITCNHDDLSIRGIVGRGNLNHKSASINSSAWSTLSTRTRHRHVTRVKPRLTSVLDLEDLDQEAEHKDHDPDPDVHGESLSVRSQHLGCERSQGDGGKRQEAVCSSDDDARISAVRIVGDKADDERTYRRLRPLGFP